MPPVFESLGDNIKQKQLEDGTVLKSAEATKVEMRTSKCTDGGTVVGDEDDYSHAKVEFLKFKLKEPRVSTESGFIEKFPCTLSDFVTKQQVSKLVLKVGSDEFVVETQNGKMELLLAKAIELPCKALLSMEYASPCGGQFFVDEHPLDLAFGVAGGHQGDQCCVIC